MKKSLFVLLLFPVLFYGQLTSDKNYVHTVNYKTPVLEGAQSAVSEDNKKEQVVYFDELGRPMQAIMLNSGGNHQEIIAHYEYDESGRQTKNYLPYVTNLSNPLGYTANVKQSIAPYYQTKYLQDFQNGLNPYSETTVEKSPSGRVLKQAAPGSAWKINPNGDDHTVKMEYRSNNVSEVFRFDIVFNNDNLIEPQLTLNGYYAPDMLYVVTTKNENWVASDGKSNTTETFTDKQGRTLLTRTYNKENQIDVPFNTYYVYDFYGNLTFVIPPTSGDAIQALFTVANPPANRNYPWTKLAIVDDELAVQYAKLFSDYQNELVSDQDLYAKYGGQGGFSLSSNSDNELTLAININTTTPMELRNGGILSLDEIGEFKDVELGRISGEGYEYIFSISKNNLTVQGKGSISSLNVNFSGNTKLVYNTNYSWASLLAIDPTKAASYISVYDQMDNAAILFTAINNEYGANGGLNITIDEEDAISLNLNITSSSALSFKKGLVIPLKIARKLANRKMGSIVSNGLRYNISIEDNSLVIVGKGTFRTASLSSVVLVNEPVYVSVNIPIQIIEGLCYEYHYDTLNRLVEKKIPGKGWEYIVYDKLNRPVLSQDANLRANEKWLFAKYDIYGRAAYTGVFKYVSGNSNETINSDLRIELQNIFDTNSTFFEARDTSTFSNGGIAINYTNTVFPTSGNDEFTIYTINYYDDYNFAPNALPLAIPNTTVNYQTAITTNVKSLPTGSLVRIVGTEQWKYSYIAYDVKARPVWSKSKNTLLNILDNAEIDLDFMGKVLETTTTHTKTGVAAIVTTDNFTYDHADRLLTHTQKVADHAEELISYNHYDDLGQLDQKKVGGIAPPSTQTYQDVSTALQTVDYNYNVRGWLKSINNPDETLSNDLFAFKINYNAPELGAEALFNGNISETTWRTSNDNKVRNYKYTYDDLNRLKQADYIGAHLLQNNSTQTENYTEGNILYDKNGNITQLLRYGLKSDATINIIDELQYQYEPGGNKLLAVTDNADQLAGFKNTNPEDNVDYSYDINGNLTKDINKSITNIEYNYLNQPTKIVFNNEDPSYSSHPRAILYVYDAAGVKISKQVIKSEIDGNDEWLPTTTTTTEYAGNYIYENGVLKFFGQGEGYVAKNGNNYSYIYQYKDQLGNVRLSYKKNEQNSSLEIVEENNYYPFGLKQQGYNIVVSSSGNDIAQRFKFNGKETEESFEMFISEMDFRQYEPSMGRFYNIDLLAETSYSETTYHFTGNNPVIGSDPTGLLTYFNGKEHNIPNQLSNHNQQGMISWFGNTEHSFFENMHNGLGMGGDYGGGDGWGLGTGYGQSGAGSYYNAFYSDFFANTNKVWGVVGREWIGNVDQGYDDNPYHINQSTTIKDVITIGIFKNVYEWIEAKGNSNFLDNWDNVNNINDQLVSPVTGIFEAGAIRAGNGINTAADIASNARVIKIAGKISTAGNVLGIGYALTNAIVNPSNANTARLVAQGTIIGIEIGVNAIVPGLGFVVGFGLSMFEQSDYMQQFYNSLDK